MYISYQKTSIICLSSNRETEQAFFLYSMSNTPFGNDTGAVILSDDPQFSFGRGNSCPYLNRISQREHRFPTTISHAC